MKHAVKTIFVAFLILLGKPPAPTAYGFECFKICSETPWSKPLDEKFWIGMRLENELRRRIKFSCDEKLLFTRFSCDDGLIFFVDISILLFLNFL